MKIFVKAKPGSKTESVKKLEGLFDAKGKETFVVAVKEKPTDGDANRAIIKAIAKHFDVAPSRVRIIAGLTSREKVIEIE